MTFDGLYTARAEVTLILASERRCVLVLILDALCWCWVGVDVCRFKTSCDNSAFHVTGSTREIRNAPRGCVKGLMESNEGSDLGTLSLH